ncbi:MAG TPA: ATP-binding cassette domain-containing protein [Flavilitoribacter sp.]|nr:ATP-binding cassette domain-containing protein [Flavilitoribacter sp.]HMQ87261.1 ATP-binding cassette domain-containing protein [Flavilitoribacter sp.]
MIRVCDISVSKGRQLIVKGGSFLIRPGKITVLLGMNGAGKSTLLDAVTGQSGYSRGSISWDNAPLETLSVEELACRRAVLGQQVQVPFSIPVRDLVEMGGYVSGKSLTRVDLRKIIETALDHAGMSAFGDRDFTTLSGGEQRRVLLAKCMVQLNACRRTGINRYLFLDEPTANLDLHHQFKLAGLVKEIAAGQQIGVFAVLHDVNLAAQFADEILLMKAGELVGAGSPEEVLTRDNLMETLGIRSIIHKHPVFGCPQITALPI